MSAADRLDAIEARACNAHDEVVRLATPGQRWRMTIPVDLGRDSDMLLDAPTNDVPALVAALRAVRAVTDRWVTRDAPHPSHDHLCPDEIAADVNAAIEAALGGESR